MNRRRMLSAAYELFCEGGYVGTTMTAIAERAGVAVQTLYFTFNTKSAILKEAFGAAVMGFDNWDPKIAELDATRPPGPLVDRLPWYPAFRDAPTAVAALGVFVDAALSILERLGPLIVVMSAGAAADPDLVAGVEAGEQRRIDDYRFVIEELAKKEDLRGGVSLERATDVLLLVLSAETHTFLANRRGWSHDACRAWFLEVLSQQLFEAPTA